jgi:hypothetical protein
MWRRWLLGSLGVCLFSSTLLAKPGIVHTKNGQTFQGDVDEKEDKVVIDIKGIRTTIDRANIDSIQYTKGVEEDYRARLAKLDAQDVKGRIELAHWAVDQGQYRLAQDALEKALAIDPNNKDASDFLDLVTRQMRLQHNAGSTDNTGAPAADNEANNGAAAPQPKAERRLLTPQDINTIRLLELKPTDPTRAIRIDPAVRNQFLTATGMTLQQFTAMRPAEQAVDIVKRGDEAMRDGVHVLADPAALAVFKSRIQSVVLPNCATSGCHGGTPRGGFMLYSPADNDAVTYTNFYILTQYAQKVASSNPAAPDSGAFGGPAQRKMLDRLQPAQSLLAQFGLPTGDARYDHPAVPGFRPLFLNKNDQRYRTLLNWLGTTLVNVQPDYGIDYALPGAATQPAATRSTAQPGGQ